MSTKCRAETILLNQAGLRELSPATQSAGQPLLYYTNYRKIAELKSHTLPLKYQRSRDHYKAFKLGANLINSNTNQFLSVFTKRLG